MYVVDTCWRLADLGGTGGGLFEAEDAAGVDPVGLGEVVFDWGVGAAFTVNDRLVAPDSVWPPSGTKIINQIKTNLKPK